MKTTFFALLAAVALTGCATNSMCVQPDPVQPASKCWNQGVNCAEGINSVNSK